MALTASCGSVATLADAAQEDCTDPNPCTVDSSDGAGGCTHVAGNAGAVCRASAGDCDVEETCTGSDTACPTDGFADGTTECRASTNKCDPAETCVGDSADCPADVTFPSKLYAATGSTTPGELYTIDKATGASTDVGPIGFSVTGLAMQPGTHRLYAVSGCASPVTGGQLATIDPATGAGTVLGTLGTGTGAPCNSRIVADISFDSLGNLYGWMEVSDLGNDDLGRIDLTTFVATAIADSPLGTSGSALAFDASDRLLYSGETNTGPLESLDTTTGLATPVTTLNGGPAGKLNAFALDPVTGAIYGNIQGVAGGTAAKASGPGSGTGTGGGRGGGNGHGGGHRAIGATATLVTVDPTTGVITAIGAMPNDIDALAFVCPAP